MSITASFSLRPTGQFSSRNDSEIVNSFREVNEEGYLKLIPA